MKDRWNSRYAAPEYVYGEMPNEFFRMQLDALPPGRLLLPADGEGRNAVYAATTGWQVTAFDWSENARAKALALAKQRSVTIDYHVLDAADAAFEAEFDVVALIFAHFPLPVRVSFHQMLNQFLRPGGLVFLEGYAKGQIAYQLRYQSGGPTSPDMLFSLDELRQELTGLEELSGEETDVVLNEGSLHQGLARVVRMALRFPL